MTTPLALVTNSLPCLPGPAPPNCDPYVRPTRGLPKLSSFWFELINLALAQKPPDTLPTDHNKGLCPGPASFSACTCPDLSTWPFKVCCILPLGPMSNKPLCFNFSYDHLLIMAHHLAPCVPCNVNLTVIIGTDEALD